MKKFKLLIGNEWVEASDRKYFTSYNPATGEAIAELAAATSEDVDAACASARDAFHNIWEDTGPDKRAKLMLKAAAIMRRREKELAKYEAVDTGKPISETAGCDIPITIEAFEYFANLASHVQGHVFPLKPEGGNDIFDFATYEPYGVVAVISPYNYPIHLLSRSLCPALAAGNTIICKASSMTPITTSILGEIILEAGFPPGVVNIISGSGRIAGEALASNKEVDIIAFTGSEEVGRRLIELSARSPLIKKTLLELGGKGPAIVTSDCDMDIAITSTVVGFCYNQGEVCCAATRLYLHEDIYDSFLKKLVEVVNGLRMGDIMDPRTQLGSLISREHLEEVDGYVKDALKMGARLLCGGERYKEPPCDKGNWYRPTILDNVPENSPCNREEVFGPVLVVHKYREIEDAIRQANDTNFGLGANIFTQNYKTAYRVARRLNAGSVWVNMPNDSKMSCPFGGNKNSGLGRDYGMIGLHEFLKVKNNMWNMSDGLNYY
jgi:acyl-CoA reductase-like NAD-dependent aldehyde dehydrogenase